MLGKEMGKGGDRGNGEEVYLGGRKRNFIYSSTAFMERLVVFRIIVDSNCVFGNVSIKII